MAVASSVKQANQARDGRKAMAVPVMFQAKASRPKLSRRVGHALMFQAKAKSQV